ncbi:MAG: hypothetical protein EZS26_003059 [Candidatus Ordinivivax streblomastigis]|uniref:Uncharacterized protein n=1 Tax=Candidatus Ordinivivax streblomastigis TaxID=2540710 RepID=A0A5M8NWK8_9BACT|nr:MAG: hypothetical protein EZS26_003059 [Candidatus Ordinivivax streblomastigis]
MVISKKMLCGFFCAMLTPYMIPYADYTFHFIIRPIKYGDF